ncbi:MAG: hypothetical protein HY866_04985 [Chloroflexi bacterium]|nr:hypothetical protein [Chloroflexota bacterium]
MHHPSMILVCHAADGHFADGDRSAVRHLLEHSTTIAAIEPCGPERYAITCGDGGQLAVYMPGLENHRSFHRIELSLLSNLTQDMLDLVFDLMAAGGFGLVKDLDDPHFIVTQPQQVGYFPWLPEPPLLVRSSHDLGYSIGQGYS